MSCEGFVMMLVFVAVASRKKRTDRRGQIDEEETAKKHVLVCRNEKFMRVVGC